MSLLQRPCTPIGLRWVARYLLSNPAFFDAFTGVLIFGSFSFPFFQFQWFPSVFKQAAIGIDPTFGQDIELNLITQLSCLRSLEVDDLGSEARVLEYSGLILSATDGCCSRPQPLKECDDTAIIRRASRLILALLVNVRALEMSLHVVFLMS